MRDSFFGKIHIKKEDYTMPIAYGVVFGVVVIAAALKFRKKK